MIMWNQTYGDANNDYYAWAVTQTSDGGYALSGEVTPIDRDTCDAFLIITDSSGNAAMPSTSNSGLNTLYVLAAVIIVILIVAIVAVFVLLRRKPKQPQLAP
jgi:hypothetical protein